MKGIKLSPLLMFVLLLIILVISVVYGRLTNTEGFIAFQKDKQPLEQVWIPQYSKNETVHKLNDNMFFDARNGNLIELDAEEYSDKVEPTAPAVETAAVSVPPATGDAAVIITNAGVETAVKTAVNTAAPYIKEMAERKNAQNELNQNAQSNVLPDPETGLMIKPPDNTPEIDVDNMPSVEEANKILATDAINAAANAAANATAEATSVSSIKPDASSAVEEAAKAAKLAAEKTQQALDIATDGTEPFTNAIDTTGSTITRVIITPRTGTKSIIYNIKPTDIEGRDTVESKTSGIASSYASWSYATQCVNTTRKSVLYMSWKSRTYIVIVDKLCDTQPYSLYMFGPNNQVEYRAFTKEEVLDIYPHPIIDNTSNTIVKDKAYNELPVYKISKSVEYDIQTGNLLVNPDGQGKLEVYNRNGHPVDITTMKPEDNNVAIVNFNPWIIKLGKTMTGLYIPHEDNTLVCILNEGADVGLANVKRFTPAGVDLNGTVTPAPTTPVEEEDVSDNSDYILKTQIVPPVCPTCPACPDNVTCSNSCSNCGGQGGSGTLDNDGKSMVEDEKPKRVVYQVMGEDGVIRNVVGSTVDLARDAVSGADDLARDTVSGTVDLAKDAATGTVGLAREVASGTVGLARDTVSGTTGFLKDTASSVSGLFRRNPTYLQNNAIQQGGVPNTMQQGGVPNTMPQGGANMPQMNNGMVAPQVTDNSTYFGALPNKTSNYMPITADFSAFSS